MPSRTDALPNLRTADRDGEQLRAAARRFELQFLAERPSAAESARQHAAILDATVRSARGKAARLLEDNGMRGLRRVEQGVRS